MTFDGSDSALACAWRDDDVVPTRRLATGYPERRSGAETDVVDDAGTASGQLFTAQHAAALFQTHAIADAFAQMAPPDMQPLEREIVVVERSTPLVPVLSREMTPVYFTADTLVDVLTERASRRRIALTCLVAGAGLFFWAGLMAVRQMPRAGGPEMLSRVQPQPSLAPRFVSDTGGEEPMLAETERQLAMAERLVAEGSILAARSVLTDLAGFGDARALFALAETFDPHMIAFWRVRVPPDPEEARRLYAAAGESGHLDAARRLDALP
ncbi:MAG: hypothetical protein ABL898_06130 [Hyphomicrobiaceae bacterium]